MYVLIKSKVGKIVMLFVIVRSCYVKTGRRDIGARKAPLTIGYFLFALLFAVQPSITCMPKVVWHVSYQLIILTADCFVYLI
jgi:hypothetical protein